MATRKKLWFSSGSTKIFHEYFSSCGAFVKFQYGTAECCVVDGCFVCKMCLFLLLICGCIASGFKVMYTDSSSSSSLARRLSLPFQTLRARLPSIWQNTPNTRTHWSSQTSLCPRMASQVPVSSWRALWLCADHFWDLFCYRLRWLVHWDRNVSPKSGDLSD